ncbi:TPA: hypothetical protein WI184_000917 [Neisseria meningitidis]|nr:hypothetical protein [Neisseria meningitidis]MBW4011091.1 hypothetical protein [Neisseria meningitidis]
MRVLSAPSYRCGGMPSESRAGHTETASDGICAAGFAFRICFCIMWVFLSFMVFVGGFDG